MRIGNILFPSFCLAAGLCLLASPAQAKHKKHPGSPDASETPDPSLTADPAGGTGSEMAPPVAPGELPSVSLQPFLDRRLSQILAPLGQANFGQPEVIASLKAAYADGMAAAPPARRPAFQAALNVCDALAGAITERQTASSALKGAVATHNSEIQQPHGGVGQGREELKTTDTFFADSQKNSWTQRAVVLRQNIMALYLHERDLERQAPAAPTPAAAPLAPGAAAIFNPPAAAAAPAP